MKRFILLFLLLTRNLVFAQLEPNAKDSIGNRIVIKDPINNSVSNTGSIRIGTNIPAGSVNIATISGVMQFTDDGNMVPTNGNGLEIKWGSINPGADICARNRSQVGQPFTNLNFRGSPIIFKNGDTEIMRVTTNGLVYMTGYATSPRYYVGTPGSATDYFYWDGSGISKTGSGYFYISQGTLYVQQTAMFRGALQNDQGNLTISDTVDLGGNTVQNAVFSGNGSNIVKADRILVPTSVYGTLGFAYGDYYGQCWQVAFADSDARIAVSFSCVSGGNFDIIMVWTSSENNAGKALRWQMGIGASANSAMAYNVNNSTIDIPMPPQNLLTNTVVASCNGISDNSTIYASFNKVTTDGGALGAMILKGFYLKRTN